MSKENTSLIQTTVPGNNNYSQLTDENAKVQRLLRCLMSTKMWQNQDLPIRLSHSKAHSFPAELVVSMGVLLFPIRGLWVTPGDILVVITGVATATKYQ